MNKQISTILRCILRPMAMPYAACRKYTRIRRCWRPKKYHGYTQYTVVGCVYNVAPYLDDYFRSITEQILDFKKHIQLILIDDGSTDASAQLIHSWQQRFPDNIHYVYKENGGVNSARNLGLSMAQTPWVTFIDPDDFIDCHYFLHVDNFLRSKEHDLPSEPLKVIACNYIYFDEKKGLFQDRHPLRFRFVKAESSFPSTSPHALQLSVNSAFINRSMVTAAGIVFDERRWGTFDDAHFMLRFINNEQSGLICFLSKARYYYRRRADKSSNLNTAPFKKQSYLSVLKEACLELLEHYHCKNQAVPYKVQWTVLYHVSFLMKQLLSGFPIGKVLSKREMKLSFQLLNNIFLYIDESIILAFDPTISHFNEVLKSGVLSRFKPHTKNIYLGRIVEVDKKKRIINIRYGSNLEIAHDILIDKSNIEPLHKHVTSLYLLEEKFIYQHTIQFALPEKVNVIALKNKMNTSVLIWHRNYFVDTLSVDALFES